MKPPILGGFFHLKLFISRGDIMRNRKKRILFKREAEQRRASEIIENKEVIPAVKEAPPKPKPIPAIKKPIVKEATPAPKPVIAEEKPKPKQQKKPSARKLTKPKQQKKPSARKLTKSRSPKKTTS
jgi:outer membrane biosynthesis protein TonB